MERLFSSTTNLLHLGDGHQKVKGTCVMSYEDVSSPSRSTLGMQYLLPEL